MSDGHLSILLWLFSLQVANSRRRSSQPPGGRFDNFSVCLLEYIAQDSILGLAVNVPRMRGLDWKDADC